MLEGQLVHKNCAQKACLEHFCSCVSPRAQLSSHFCGRPKNRSYGVNVGQVSRRALSLVRYNYPDPNNHRDA